MNNAELGVTIRTSEKEITNSLLSQIDKVLELLDMGSIPNENECLELQDMLRLYIQTLSHETDYSTSGMSTSESTIHVVFEDISSDDINSNNIISDLLSDESIVSIIYKIGLRKIVKEEELAISRKQISWLKEKRYISRLTIEDGQKSYSYVALTSKGWLCFRRKNIVVQVRKAQGFTSLFLPEWLAVPQTKWEGTTYYRALLLLEYYEKYSSGKDYMIFSFPENNQLLFGCKSDAEKEVTYTCAISEKTLMTDEEIKTLSKVVNSETVDHVILVFSNEDTGQSLIESLHLKATEAKKIGTYILEAVHE